MPLPSQRRPGAGPGLGFAAVAPVQAARPPLVQRLTSPYPLGYSEYQNRHKMGQGFNAQALEKCQHISQVLILTCLMQPVFTWPPAAPKSPLFCAIIRFRSWPSWFLFGYHVVFICIISYKPTHCTSIAIVKHITFLGMHNGAAWAFAQNHLLSQAIY